MIKSRSLQEALTETNIAGGAERLPNDVIKSAGRALQILELFDVLQRQATVTEIAELLHYPQSSTTMLLRSLVSMGYLNYNIRARTYVTSSRVALLGKWAASTLVSDGRIIRLMRRISDRSEQAVVLAVRKGLMVQYIHVVQATSSTRLYVMQGSMRPLIQSGTGFALLADQSESDVRRIVLRTNADGGVDGHLIREADVLAQVRLVHERGYALTSGLVKPDSGMLAVPLSRDLAADIGQPAVVGIGSLTTTLMTRREELLGIIREELEHARLES
jgi:IclR family transcriptional regulator, acetate operon repressor